MIRKFSVWEWLPAVLLTAGCFSFFLFFYPYHNLFKEQMTLFLFSRDYFLTFFGKPAWLVRYAGEFLTQFYIFPAAGALIVTGTFLSAWVLLRSIFRQFELHRTTAAWLALLPVVPEFLFHCNLHYPLGSTLSGLMALGTALAFTKCRPALYKWLFLPVAPLLYYLSGHGIFLFTILWVAFGIFRKDIRWYYSFLPVLFSLSIPLLLRPYFQLSPAQAYRFPLKAPLSYRMDFTVEKILALDYAVQQENWARVLFLSHTYNLNNSMAVYSTNLALSQTRLMGDWLFQFRQPGHAGLFLPVSPQSTPLAIVFSNEVYFRLGDLNLAQHAAMLGMIFSPNHRSSRLVKRLAEIHIAIGDGPAAEKYLGLLEKTLFYRKWAGEARELLTREQIPLREKVPSIDTVRLADDYPTTLEILLQSHPDNKTALDYLLCYHLLNKDIPSFRQAYNTWVYPANERIPEVYAQALIVSLFQEGADNETLKEHNIPASVISEFMDYTRAYEQASGLSAPLQERFGNTFWFYYHFAMIQ